MPDGKKESDYPFSEKTSPEEWTWEFLKRNPNYRKDYTDMLATYKKLEKDHGPKNKWNKKEITNDPRACIYNPLRKKGESDNQWIHRCLNNGIPPHRYFICRGLGIKWGLEELYNPKLKCSKRIKFIPAFNSKYPQRISTLQIFNLNELIDDNSEDDLRVVEDKVILAFDLTTSIKSQTDKAYKKLNSIKNNLKITSHKHRPDVWAEYLRIYDARKLGVTFSEIAKFLNPETFKSHDKNKHRITDKIRAQFEQAKKMVMENYKYILRMGPKT